MNFENALQRSVEVSGLIPSHTMLKEPQKQALEMFYEGDDLMALLPTGYGKSLIFQLSPFLAECKAKEITSKEEVTKITLVITPLNAIMRDQVQTLCDLGIKACFVDYEGKKLHSYQRQDYSDSDSDSDSGEAQDQLEISCSLDKITSYNLIYAHPEAILSSKKGRKIIKDIRQHVCCIALDEAHMVTQWGESFRKDFSQIKTIASMLPEVPTMLLTATATSEVQKLLLQTLEIHNIRKVVVNPDRPNIKYDLIFRGSSSDQEEYLETLLGKMAKEMKDLGKNYPLTIVYTDYESIVTCIGYFHWAFPGDSKYAYMDPIPDNLIFNMYHGSTTKKMQDVIVKELSKYETNLRVVFATNALGMGLDARHIRRVVHFKSPNTLDEYLQQSGRAGRDGKQSYAILHYNNTDVRKGKKDLDEDMKLYCQEGGCLRVKLLKHLGFQADPDRDRDMCCSLCEGSKE